MRKIPGRGLAGAPREQAKDISDMKCTHKRFESGRQAIMIMKIIEGSWAILPKF